MASKVAPKSHIDRPGDRDRGLQERTERPIIVDSAATVVQRLDPLTWDPAINHPSHYGGDSQYEAIKVIEAWELNFRVGNAVKYIRRSTAKERLGKLRLQDLRKAIWYLQREVDKLDGTGSGATSSDNM